MFLTLYTAEDDKLYPPSRIIKINIVNICIVLSTSQNKKQQKNTQYELTNTGKSGQKSGKNERQVTP